MILSDSFQSWNCMIYNTNRRSLSVTGTHFSRGPLWCKEFYLTFSWNLIPASVQYTLKYLTSHTLKEKSYFPTCNNNELLWVRQQTVVLSLANNSHNCKIVYLPCFIYYSYVHTLLPHVYAYTEFLRKAKQVIYCF